MCSWRPRARREEEGEEEEEKEERSDGKFEERTRRRVPWGHLEEYSSLVGGCGVIIGCGMRMMGADNCFIECEKGI